MEKVKIDGRPTGKTVYPDSYNIMQTNFMQTNFMQTNFAQQRLAMSYL